MDQMIPYDPDAWRARSTIRRYGRLCAMAVVILSLLDLRSMACLVIPKGPRTQIIGL